jgi:hypothetical protein
MQMANKVAPVPVGPTTPAAKPAEATPKPNAREAKIVKMYARDPVNALREAGLDLTRKLLKKPLTWEEYCDLQSANDVKYWVRRKAGQRGGGLTLDSAEDIKAAEAMIAAAKAKLGLK